MLRRRQRASEKNETDLVQMAAFHCHMTCPRSTNELPTTVPLGLQHALKNALVGERERAI